MIKHEFETKLPTGIRVQKMAQDKGSPRRHGTGISAVGKGRVRLTRAIDQGSGAEQAVYTCADCF